MFIKDEDGRPVEVKLEDYPPMHERRTAMANGLTCRPYGWREARCYESELEDRAEQGMKDAVDINSIIRKHQETGALTHVARVQPTYGDATGARDLQEAYSLIERAEQEFVNLPWRIRDLVDNDPVEYLAALADPERIVELAEAGLPMAEGWEPPELEAEPPAAPPEPPTADPPQPEGDPPQTS